MAVLTPTAEKGRTIFEAGGPTRTHDDTGDSKIGVTYDHEPLEWSATEADEWDSWMLFVQSIIQTGGGALPIRNTTGGTLTKGTLLYVSGYDSGSGKFTVTKAVNTTKNAAQVVLSGDLANNTNGYAYGFTVVTGTVSQPLDTSGAAAVGSLAYLSDTAGVFTFTLPDRVDRDQQIVGIVTVKNATTGAIAFFPSSRIFLKRAVNALQGVVVSPSSIGANQTNYAPTGISTATVLRLTSSGNYDIISLDPTGRTGTDLLVVHNIGANTLTFKKDDGATGTAAWRFDITADTPLLSKGMSIFQYDTTSSRWRIVSGSGSGAGGGNLAQCGDASDGDYDLDGNSVTGAITGPTGSEYTLARDVYADEIIVRNTYTLLTAGFRILARTSFLAETGSVVSNNGGNAANEVAGTGAAEGTLGGGANGGTGDDGNGDAGSNTSEAAGGNGGNGGAGGATSGGAGGTATDPTLNAGGTASLRAVPGAATGRDLTGTKIQGGGGGGAGGGQTAVGNGGGGGGGAGGIIIISPSITGAGTIRANGGSGGDGEVGSNSGGGGGGGGGFIVTISDNDVTATSLTLEVDGGSGGAPQGTGSVGSAGADGLIVNLTTT